MKNLLRKFKQLKVLKIKLRETLKMLKETDWFKIRQF